MEDIKILLIALAIGIVVILAIKALQGQQRSLQDKQRSSHKKTETKLHNSHQVIFDNAQRFTDIINESLEIANRSKNIDTKISRLDIAKKMLSELKQLSKQNSFLVLEHLAQVEESISNLDREFTQNNYKEISNGNMRGKALEKEGNIDLAIREYENLLKKEVDTPFTYRRLAIIYSKRKQTEEELRVLRTAIKNVPIDNNTHYQWFKERLEKKSADSFPKKKLSLEKQCEKLSLPLEEIELDYDDKPEPALLRHYESLGYIGSYIEGHTILTVLKALMLDKLAELNTFGERSDACTRYLEAQFTIHKHKLDEIIDSVRHTKKEKYLSNLKEILHQPFIRREHPELSIECCEALFDAIDTNTFIAIAEKFSEDPYTYRSGWPDLTLIKGKEVKFVEVKTTDKLHASQLKTIPAFSQILPYNFSVCRVTPLRVNQRSSSSSIKHG